MPRKKSHSGSVGVQATEGAAADLARARSWGYQLQKLDLAATASAPHDLIVIDYARDGSHDTALTPQDLANLKLKPDGTRRLVYAYISVGEAESYRFYWRKEWRKSPPDWIVAENSDWKGNFLVAFWHDDWRSILLDPQDGYITRIAAQGFDGLYLDRCDVFEDLEDADHSAIEDAGDLEQRMVDFIAGLSAHVRATHPGLGLIMQNAEQLLSHKAVLMALDGMAKEELLFGMSGGSRRNARSETAEARQDLDRARRSGRPVFCVEYLDDDEKRATAISEIAQFGFVPYVARADRELDTLEPPADPDSVTS
ncbi:MAG: MJ1477/TM1410 family putative glycoside hydrolase [Hyphomicrobiaceae bacterium]